MSEYELKRPRINGRKSEVWYITWSENGRSRRRSTGETDKLEAQRYLQEYKSAVGNIVPGDFDTRMLCEAYQADRQDQVRYPKALEVSLKQIKARLGLLHPLSLKPAQIKMYIKSRKADGVSDGTIRKEMLMLRTALQWGVDHEWIDKVPKIEAPPSAPARRRFLTGSEFDRLLEAAETIHTKTFLNLGIYTGQRQGAILELTWDNVDWENKIIWFPHGHVKKRRAAVTANSSLMKALEIAYQTRECEYVVSWNGKPIKSMKTAFRRSVKRAGLEDVRIHDLRRTAASWLLQAGGTISEAAALLADDEATVRKHYGQFDTNFLRTATERIAR